MIKPFVLVVEPDRIIAASIQKYLSKQGYNVNWQASAQAAVASADQQIPDVIVLDIQLAGHGGVELLHELRSYGDWQSIPVIIYSSIHPDEFGGQATATAALTAQAYLHKPSTSLAELAAQIEQCLQVKT